MDEKVYHKNFEVEESYWWFVARNKIIKDIIQKYCQLPKGSTILDIGCGTGSFAKGISEDYIVHCLDTSPLALKYCKMRGLQNLYNCTVQEFQPLDLKINTVTMLDVLEHIEDDRSVVRRVYELLEVNGYFVATVPAYKWLWSGHDVLHQHWRRYRSNEIINILKKEGFRILYHTYFDTLLFPVAALKRIIQKFFNINNKNIEPVDPVPNIINKIFTGIFSIERYLIPKIKFPFGLSILVVAVKDE
jgi:ubiquinone/menaquinone biosynthesis C-methylase UbiE